MRKVPVLYLVVPCFNEEEALPLSIKLLRKKLDHLIKSGKVKPSSRLLLVDDGSTDGTWQIIERQKFDKVLGLKLDKNHGQQYALLSGLLFATGQDIPGQNATGQNTTQNAKNPKATVTITLDADLQDDINAIDAMLEAYKKGNDVVYGVRSSRASDSRLKRTTANFYYRLAKKLGVHLVDNAADFRLLTPKVIKALKPHLASPHLFLRGLVPTLSYKSATVYYERKKRIAGRSKYTLPKMFTLALDGLLAASQKAESLFQFVKFVITGTINTASSWAFYYPLLFLGLPYPLCTTVAYVAGSLIGYHLNNRWTFKTKIYSKTTILKYCLTYASSFLLNLSAMFIFTDLLKIDPKISPFLVLFITVPYNFLLNKLWVFKAKENPYLKNPKKYHTFAICAHKTSPYLEDLIKSLENQTIKSNIILCSSTENPHIKRLAKKYHIKTYFRTGKSDIQADWNFAVKQVKTPLVTIAHQDDLYAPTYLENILANFTGHELLLMTDNFYLINNKSSDHKNLKIKRLLKFPLKIPGLSNLRPLRKLTLAFGNTIQCPSATYNRKKLGNKIFTSKLKFALDWDTFLKIYQKKGKIAYIPRPLISFRISDESTTKLCDRSGLRRKEDELMFKKFWPSPIARLLMHFYTDCYNVYNYPKIRLAKNDLEFIFCELRARLLKPKIIKNLKRDHPEIADYLKHHSPAVFPYDFPKKYHLSAHSVTKDPDNHLLYIEHQGQKLYLRKKYRSAFRAKRYYNNLLIEQDPHSPHYYATPPKNSVILDVGGAEGLFSLQHLNTAKQIFIFECNPEWIAALKHTFKDQPKVTIINQKVSNQTTKDTIALDDFIKEQNLLDEPLFIKVDAEGYEPLIIDGLRETLSSKSSDFSLALCTYHLAAHEKILEEKLAPTCDLKKSPGYMLYYYDLNFKPPYLRRGVLSARKSPTPPHQQTSRQQSQKQPQTPSNT